MLKPNRLYFILPALMLSVACVENQDGSGDNAGDADSTKNAGTENALVGEIYSIPSPVQSAILVKKSGAPFNESLLNSPSKSATYLTEYQKALNLGVYGADLSYLAGYGNKQLSVDYIAELERIASELDMIKYIDKTLITRFQNNIDNADSLYAINADFYGKSDRYLKNSDRNKVAGLIIAGGWIESVFISTQLAPQAPELRSRIGEQRRAVNAVTSLLASYDDPQMAELNKALQDLKMEFDALQSTYVYEKPIDDQAARTTYLKGKTEVSISDEQLSKIAEKVSAVRSIIIR